MTGGAFLDAVHSEDAGDTGEQSQQEDANQTQPLEDTLFEFEEARNGQQPYPQVR